jgi:hypothetical protein
MPPDDLVLTERARIQAWAFLADFRRRARESKDVDTVLLDESRRAIDDSRALLRRMEINHPGL